MLYVVGCMLHDVVACLCLLCSAASCCVPIFKYRNAAKNARREPRWTGGNGGEAGSQLAGSLPTLRGREKVEVGLLRISVSGLIVFISFQFTQRCTPRDTK